MNVIQTDTIIVLTILWIAAIAVIVYDRIKPKYRPFKDAEECWQEMLKHQPFGWVKLKATRKYFICKAIGDFFAVVGLNDRPTNYDELFEEYIFADGTPFGVKVEE